MKTVVEVWNAISIKSASKSNDKLPILSVLKMVEGKVYEIRRIERVKNIFTEKIMVISNQYEIFLPKIFTKLPDEALLQITYKSYGIRRMGGSLIQLIKLNWCHQECPHTTL